MLILLPNIASLALEAALSALLEICSAVASAKLILELESTITKKYI
jgi:hypothetical protein